MIKIALIFLIFASAFGNAEADFPVANEVDDFDVSALSIDGQKAYETLIKANRFESGHIGRGGNLSAYVKNFNVLRNEAKADAAFKSIEQNGTIYAKLYALSGLYFTDYRYFQARLKKYENNTEKIMTISGCILSEIEISEIISSSKEKVAVVKPDQTTGEFFEILRKSYNIDIANGGYPATFKSFAK